MTDQPAVPEMNGPPGNPWRPPIKHWPPDPWQPHPGLDQAEQPDQEAPDG